MLCTLLTVKVPSKIALLAGADSPSKFLWFKIDLPLTSYFFYFFHFSWLSLPLPLFLLSCVFLALALRLFCFLTVPPLIFRLACLAELPFSLPLSSSLLRQRHHQQTSFFWRQFAGNILEKKLVARISWEALCVFLYVLKWIVLLPPLYLLSFSFSFSLIYNTFRLFIKLWRFETFHLWLKLWSAFSEAAFVCSSFLSFSLIVCFIVISCWTSGTIPVQF